MPKKVPYLQEEQIERDAAALLAEFAQTHNRHRPQQIRVTGYMEYLVRISGISPP